MKYKLYIMKKLLSILFLQTVVILSLLSQAVSDYSYKLDNGINVKMDHCWNQVWVQQTYAPMNATDKTPALSVNITSVSYTHLRAHETRHDLVCRLLLEK